MKPSLKIALVILVFITVVYMMIICSKTPDQPLLPPSLTTEDSLEVEGDSGVIVIDEDVLMDGQPDGKGYPLAKMTQNELYQAIAATTTELALVDTSNWLVYENIEYGFEFLYPSDLELDIRPARMGKGGIFVGIGVMLDFSVFELAADIDSFDSSTVGLAEVEFSNLTMVAYADKFRSDTFPVVNVEKDGFRFSFSSGLGFFGKETQEVITIVDSFKLID